MAVDPAKLKIVQHPDARLRRKAEPITLTPKGGASAEVRAVAARMIQLMHEAGGVGLAAPQVGLSWRMFVANPSGGDDAAGAGEDRVFVNPVLVNPSPQTAEVEEGCLSIPGVHVHVRRPMRITLRAHDLDGRPVELTSDELPARVWQHENDHLDGVLIIDRMTPMDRLANRRALQELESEAK
jgi:peptide deformylase